MAQAREKSRRPGGGLTVEKLIREERAFLRNITKQAGKGMILDENHNHEETVLFKVNRRMKRTRPGPFAEGVRR